MKPKMHAGARRLSGRSSSPRATNEMVVHQISEIVPVKGCGARGPAAQGRAARDHLFRGHRHLVHRARGGARLRLSISPRRRCGRSSPPPGSTTWRRARSALVSPRLDPGRGWADARRHPSVTRSTPVSDFLASGCPSRGKRAARRPREVVSRLVASPFGDLSAAHPTRVRPGPAPMDRPAVLRVHHRVEAGGGAVPRLERACPLPTGLFR